MCQQEAGERGQACSVGFGDWYRGRSLCRWIGSFFYIVWWSGRWSIGSAPQIRVERRWFRVRGSHGDPICRWDSPMGNIYLQSLFAGGHPWQGPFLFFPKRALKWDPSLFPGCHPWQGPFCSPQKTPKMHLWTDFGRPLAQCGFGTLQGVPKSIF